MKLMYKDEELELNFKTKNYEFLKKDLNTENLRYALLKAAQNLNFEVLAKAIKRFAENNKIKNFEDVYDIIDDAPDKQSLFYEFIEELGAKGFFGEANKKTIEELKVEEIGINLTDADILDLTKKAIPGAMEKAIVNQSSTKTGANTSLIYV